MDKPLGIIHLMMTAVLLAIALGAVSALPFGGDAGSLADYIRAQWHSERLCDDKGLLSRSREVNEELVAAAIAGRLSLTEAAAAMRAENEDRPPHLRAGIFPFRGVSVEESYMRHIIYRIEVVLADDSRRGDVLKRLRAELQAYLNIPTCSVSTKDSPVPEDEGS